MRVTQKTLRVTGVSIRYPLVSLTLAVLNYLTPLGSAATVLTKPTKPTKPTAYGRNMSEYISVKDAAKRLHITHSHALRLVAKGHLSAVRTTPRKTRVSVASLERYIDANNFNK